MIGVQLTPWSTAAERDLAPAMAGDPHGIDGLAADVEQRRALLFEVLAEGDLVGHFAVRVDQFAHGRDLVVIAAGGRLPGVDLTRSVSPAFDELARRAGCDSVRVHTRSPALARKLAGVGFCEAERVLTRGVA
jgi:hypothetical protein